MEYYILNIFFIKYIFYFIEEVVKKEDEKSERCLKKSSC